MRSTMFDTSPAGKKLRLKRDVEKGSQVVLDLLEQNEIRKACIYLSCIESFELFLKKTNYFVFNWALENDNVTLLNWLFEHVRPEHHLLMVSHNDYASIQQFIQKTLSMDNVTYNIKATSKQVILKLLIDVDSESSAYIQCELKRYAEDKSSLYNQQTLIDFKKDLTNLLIAAQSSQSVSFSVKQTSLK